MTDEATIVMEDNLNQIWNEKDPEVRLKAIERIYSSTATLNHVGDQVTGFDAINNSVSATQKIMSSNFVFTRLKPVIINNSVGRPVASGMDVAHFENGRIKSLYVFLDN